MLIFVSRPDTNEKQKMSDVENETPPHSGSPEEEKRIPRIFVNYIDQYTAKAIGELLSKSFPGKAWLEL